MGSQINRLLRVFSQNGCMTASDVTAHCVLVDLAKATSSGADLWSDDEVHLSPLGYDMFSDLILAKLRSHFLM